MNKNLIIAIVLVVLVAVSVIQTVQLTTLKTKIAESGVSVKSSGSTTPSLLGQAGSTPSDLDSLPNMVGGC